jgi:hypothetical protein
MGSRAKKMFIQRARISGRCLAGTNCMFRNGSSPTWMLCQDKIRRPHRLLVERSIPRGWACCDPKSHETTCPLMLHAPAEVFCCSFFCVGETGEQSQQRLTIKAVRSKTARWIETFSSPPMTQVEPAGIGGRRSLFKFQGPLKTALHCCIRPLAAHESRHNVGTIT